MAHLNQDCLYQIFTNLDLQNQLKVSRVSKLFEDIIVDWILRYQFHTLDSEDPRLVALENDDIQTLYQLIPYNVKRLRIIEPNNMKLTNQLIHSVDFLLSHDFCNLEEFEGSDQRITNIEIGELLNNCRKLRNLKIRSFNVTGIHIAHMPELKKLTLTGCSLSQDYLRQILLKSPITYLKVIKNRVHIELALLNTHSITLEELVIDSAQGYGVLLADKLNLRSLHYDTRRISWTDLCPQQIVHIKRTTTFQFLKGNLQFFGFGKTKNALLFLIDLLKPINEKYPHLVGMGIFLQILRLVNSCKNLKSIELETSTVDNFNSLKLLVNELERQQRILDITISYSKESDRLNQQKQSLSESFVYKYQNRLTINFKLLSKAQLDDIHLIKYGLKRI